MKPETVVLLFMGCVELTFVVLVVYAVAKFLQSL
jgi:hypothetical protein